MCLIQRNIVIWVIIILSIPCSGLATPKEFIENYTYNAGEADSKLTCRTVSLLEIKRLLLEKIGTYLESRTEIKDFQIQKDEIVALTAGVVKLEILDEKWNGERYSLTAKIEANPDDIARAIDEFRKQGRSTENFEKIKKINDESFEQLRELQARMQQLQTELLKINQDASASEGLLNAWGLYEKAVELRQSGKLEEAITALNTVIRNTPTHLAYFERGLVHLELKMYDEAIADLTETLKVEPNMRVALWSRGLSYMRSGKKRIGRRDIEKAAKLGNPRALKWLEEYPDPMGSGNIKRKS